MRRILGAGLQSQLLIPGGSDRTAVQNLNTTAFQISPESEVKLDYISRRETAGSRCHGEFSVRSTGWPLVPYL